jgi:hypothetical protein
MIDLGDFVGNGKLIILMQRYNIPDYLPTKKGKSFRIIGKCLDNFPYLCDVKGRSPYSLMMGASNTQNAI